jgi:tRNA A-37 threonylcarbamoyl transferase component Bud32/uncharacterized membrane protein YbhN (UPF0104 family)
VSADRANRLFSLGAAGSALMRLRPVFGRTSEEPSRRRLSDLVRLAVASTLLAVLVAQQTQLPGTTEFDIFRLFNSLPSGTLALFRALEGIGTLWAVSLVVAAALVGRRWRLARDLLLSGLVAWVVSQVLESEVVSQIGLRASLRILTHVGVLPGSPLVHLSVVVAVVATAGPYVTRPTRRLGRVLVVALVLGAAYVGTTYPADLLAALLIALIAGWGVAAAIHLTFGSPSGQPSISQLEATLASTGVVTTSVRLSPHQDPDATVFDSADQAGPLEVKVIGRDERNAQLLAKTWRFVAYKEPAPPLQLSRLQQVEHEACMTLLAGSAGVFVPKVVFVGQAGPGTALLIIRPLEGPRLNQLEADAVTDSLLELIWREVAKLHSTGVAHGALDAAHVVISNGVPGIVSFATAATSETARSRYRRAKDVAELLVATAGIVGDERAVAACVNTLGGDAIVPALPFLQPEALHRQTRASLGTHNRDVQPRLDAIRRMASDTIGVEPPALQKLQRLRPSSVLLAAGSLVAIGVLLAQVGDPAKVWAVTRHAQWGWLSLALLTSLATNIFYAVALMGTLSIRLPLWPTTELQVGMSFSNLVIPVIGGIGFQIRFLQREGADLPAAVAAGGLLSTAGTVITQLPLFALAIWLAPNALHLGGVPVHGILEVVALTILGLGVIGALVFGVPQLRRAVLPPVRGAISTIWAAMRSLRQLSLIVGGNLIVSLLYGLCLLACVRAFGISLSFWTMLAVYIGIGSLAALIPIPGGIAAVGGVGLAAALVGFGVPTNAAVAATLTNQLVVNYIPALPGWFATRHLLRHNYL